MQLQLMHKGRLAIYADIMYNACERKKRLARIGIRRPSSQLGPALRLTTGRDNFYIYSELVALYRSRASMFQAIL